MKLHHLGIQVKDINKSIKFYVDILGFLIKKPKTQEGIYTYIYLVHGDSEVQLELFQIKDEKPQKIEKLSSNPHFAFESFNLDKDLQEVKSKGVQIDGPHEIPHDIRYFTILDPDHYRIDIGQLLK
jgi:catechol 2,3-dioxygenase-like lactoylglutathione lyase family enzyme